MALSDIQLISEIDDARQPLASSLGANWTHYSTACD